jgi:hypothetical protein
MPFAFTQDLPFTPDVYERFCAALPDETPSGMILRFAQQIENGVRVTEVWQSEEDRARFVKDRLAPIVQDGFFASTGYAPPGEEPALHHIDVIDVWHGAEMPSLRSKAPEGTHGSNQR